MRTARPLADVLTLIVSSVHCVSVSSNIVWLKGFGSPKKASCRLFFKLANALGNYDTRGL